MAIYLYKGKNQQGKRASGRIFAENEADARKQLAKNNFEVKKVWVAPKNPPFWERSFGTVSFKEKIVFLKYLSTILKAGLSIKKALGLLANQISNRYFAQIISEIREAIDNGQAFHESLRKYPKVFSDLFVNLIEVGESSGSLPKSLEYLEDILQRDYEFRKKIKGAMIYPAVVMSLLVVVTVLLIRFIVPKITQIFETFRVELPLPTQIVIGSEKFLSDYWWWLILGTFGLIVGVFLAMRVRAIRKARDRVFLEIPVIGSLIKQIQLAHLTRITASMLTSGLTLVSSLEIASRTLPNLVFVDYMSKSMDYLKSGGEFSEYLAKRPDLFQVLSTQMVRLGETTGSLPHTLSVLADLNEEEVSDKLKVISGLIGPVMLIVMAALVGGIAISIITPIYQLPSLLQA